MGRKSKLSENEWAEVVRECLVEKRPMREVAEKWGISAASVHNRISERSETVKDAAVSMVEAEQKMRALPIAERIIALDFASSLRDISNNLCSAAANGASNASRLSAMAALQLGKIDPENPLDSAEHLQAVSGLTKLANDSATLGMNLLNANKKDSIESPAQAKPLSHFYGGGK